MFYSDDDDDYDNYSLFEPLILCGILQSNEWQGYCWLFLRGWPSYHRYPFYLMRLVDICLNNAKGENVSYWHRREHKLPHQRPRPVAGHTLNPDPINRLCGRSSIWSSELSTRAGDGHALRLAQALVHTTPKTLKSWCVQQLVQATYNLVCKLLSLRWCRVYRCSCSHPIIFCYHFKCIL